MPGKVQYTVEPIDVDGDNIPDGDLVTKYVNGKVASRKFVPLSTLKKTFKSKQVPTEKQGKKEKIVYKTVPKDISSTDKPVVIQDGTGFGQYVKAGAGATLGSLAVSKLFEGIGSFFSDEN